MPIIDSLLRDNTLQADGSHNVTERHTDHAGRTYDIVYNCPVGVDPLQVLSVRAAKIGAEVDARDVAEALATNFDLPISWVDFIDRFTPQERIAVRAARLVDPMIDDFLDLGEKRGAVYLRSPRLAAALDYMVGAGLLAASRKAEVLA